MKILLIKNAIIYWYIFTLLTCKTMCALAPTDAYTSNAQNSDLKNHIKPFEYLENKESTIIGKYIWILKDKSRKLTIKEILASSQFNKSKSDVPNLGVSSSNFWLLFSIKNQSSNSNLLLELAQPTIDQIELYNLSKNGEITYYKTGEDQTFDKRKYKHPNYLFNLNIPKDSTETYIMKVIGSEQIILPFTLGQPKAIHESIYHKNLLSGVFAGIIIIMFIYNLFIYFTTRDESYLYYVVYIILLGLTQMTINGYTHQYLWPNNIWFSKYSITLLSSLGGIAAMLFIKKILLTKQYVPILNRVIDISIGLFCISILLSISNKQIISFQLMQINTSFSSFLVLYVGYKVLKKGYRPAKFFMLAWSFLLVGAIVFILKDFGIIPYNTLTIYSMQFASIAEVALLSFALADRINILKEEKQVAQAQELKQRIEKETILKDQAKNLKLKIDIATEELKTKNHKLNLAYRQVEATKAQLIQKEKIAALGQMAAGMSHEFNNNNTNIKLALGVIELNTSYYKKYIDFLHNILPKTKNIDKQLTDLKNYKKEIQYESIAEDLNGSFKRANNALGKIAISTKKLQDFSKIDSKGWVSTDIKSDLNNLHDLWRSNLGAIKVKLDLTNNLKQLIINAQALNDCFKNLLQNSIEAIKEKDMPEKEGLITIKTSLVNGHAVISFSDNGVGMSKEVEQKAFDFYFTTKGALRNGINLSIVQSTVVAHDGHIELETKPGEGTTIKLIIPITENKKHDKKN
jgi:signal transduction histidine kinase